MNNLGDYDHAQQPSNAGGIDGPLTRSKIKRYVQRRIFERQDESPRNGQIHGEQASSESQERNRNFIGISSVPLRQRLVTPMKAFASRFQNSLSRSALNTKKRSSWVDYNILNNSISLSLVFMSLYIIVMGNLNKIPDTNYDLPDDFVSLKIENNTTGLCVDGFTKVHILCAPEGNLEYISELEQLQKDFDTLIYSSNPILTNNKAFVERQVNNIEIYNQLIANSYFKTRVQSNQPLGASDGSKATVRLSLKGDFEVEPPFMNHIWFCTVEFLQTSEYLGTNYLIGYTLVAIITFASIYMFVIRAKGNYATKGNNSFRRASRVR